MSETETAGPGHNSGEEIPTVTVSIAVDKLRSLVERIERIGGEIKGLNDDKKDIFAEAKGAGFDVKVLREIIRIRGREPAEVEEQEAVLDTYRRALGM